MGEAWMLTYLLKLSPFTAVIMIGGKRKALPITHRDARRTIYEDGCHQVFHTLAPNTILGIHTHLLTDEHFIVLRGRTAVLHCQATKKGSGAGKVREVYLPLGSSIFIPRHTAHTFYPNHNTVMACIRSKPFNPDMPDIIPTPWLVK